MALKNGTVNPLNVLGYRVLNRIPKHFQSVYVDVDCDKPTLIRWVYTNLNSRFCVQSELNISDANYMTDSTKIGFEDPRELTMFMLTCPYLENRRNK